MFFLNLDIAPLLNVAEKLTDAAKAAMRKHGELLVAQTRAHIVEQANIKLHTRRQLYVDNLTHLQVDENTWVINLDAKARWIDDGMPEHNMIDDLLKSSKAKTAKDGSKYVVIPFQHKKGPTQMTPAQATLLNTIKSELAKQKIPYGKLETGGDGKVKLGLLHKLDIKDAPIKNSNAPGQGKGPVGAVMQGNTGIPLLQGLRIYQTKVKDKSGHESIRRDIMTFRIASSKQKGQGKWDYPGTSAVPLMAEGYDWAKRQWETNIVPGLIADINSKL